MNETLTPAIYEGEGAGIGAKFIGLNNDSYDELSISLGDGEFIKVSRNEKIPFMSTVVTFSGLEPNGIYKIRGRIIQNGVERIIECSMVGKTTPQKSLMRTHHANGGGIGGEIIINSSEMNNA